MFRILRNKYGSLYCAGKGKATEGSDENYGPSKLVALGRLVRKIHVILIDCHQFDGIHLKGNIQLDLDTNNKKIMSNSIHRQLYSQT